MALSRNILTLLVVAVACYYVNSDYIDSFWEKEGRSNLTLGSIGVNDLLLHSEISTQNATTGVNHTRDVIYRGFAVNITYIAAVENGVSQNATAVLVGGGLGAANATIRLTSAVSRGYNYTILIWGR